MSEGVKIALIVGGVAVGAYVIVKVTAPTPAAPKNTAPNASTTAFISGIVSGIGSWFTTSGKTPANAPLTNIGKDANGIPFTDGGGGSWDATSQNNLPLLPGTPAYVDDTSHDSILD